MGTFRNFPTLNSSLLWIKGVNFSREYLNDSNDLTAPKAADLGFFLKGNPILTLFSIFAITPFSLKARKAVWNLCSPLLS